MVYILERTWSNVPNFHVLPAVFSAEECGRIIDFHQAVKCHPMVIKQGAGTYRNTDVYWLDSVVKVHAWIYDKLRDVSLAFNQETYQFEIEALSDLQLAHYKADQHYNWHCDIGKDGYSRRKLSISVMLTDPASHEGGGLEFGVEEFRQPVKAGLGDAVLFPSWIPHRVLPVTRGERWSLVGWWLGPPFR